MRGEEIRRRFLQFFTDREHTVVPSHSLVPNNDPSLLLIGAGMAPLKPYFTGTASPGNRRMASCQKCVRTGDIEEVGKTARHHTFFEMLGNFSFGDYFKEEAIAFAWEFLLEQLKLDPQRLWVSVYEQDQEAWDIWHKKTGIPEQRIVRLGKEDNFWEIGVGPCGPCSEIYYDMGAQHGCGSDSCQPGCDCDRYLEIWNLVFIQFDKDQQGNYNPLPVPCIDTGMGLERMAAVMQNVVSNYDTDLVLPLIEHFSRLTGADYGDKKYTASLRIIADHLRSVGFMLADGILPGNEGRGYVVRRLLRRAVRHGMLCGSKESFLHTGVDKLVEMFADFYPELAENKQLISVTVKAEEDRFFATVEQGMEQLNKYLKKIQPGGKLPGAEAFRLYDSCGFPLELTQEIAAERSVDVDHQGFEKALEQQRQRGRAARGQTDGMAADKLKALLKDYPPTVFSGYTKWADDVKILAVLVDGTRQKQAEKGQQALVVLDKSPFYAEGGGQVGDKGTISQEGFVLTVEDVVDYDGIHLHHVAVKEGQFSVGDKARAEVSSRRKAIEANHTATHLLHKALKEVLGDHVRQAGSLVEDKRLRFDFNHSASLSPAQLREIEDRVNSLVAADLPVDSEHMALDEAKSQGAVALFGEKYAEDVRVVKVGDYSMELCGGTHVKSTSRVRAFKILSETGIGSGLRRIEAVTGDGVLQVLFEAEHLLDEAAAVAKVSREALPQRIGELNSQLREARQQAERLQAKVLSLEEGNPEDEASDVEGIAVLARKVDTVDMAVLRTQAEMLISRLGQGVVLVAAVAEGKVNLVAVVSKDLAGSRVNAGKLVGAAAKLVGGGGGGRPDMAQAGGRQPEKVDEMLKEVPRLVREQL